MFTDTYLQAIIEKTLANNPDLLNAALNIDIAEQQLKLCQNWRSCQQLHSHHKGTISHFGSHVEATKSYTLPITASWEIDLFGKLRNAKKAAQMSMIQMQDYKVAVQTKLICNVANLYYTLLMLDRQNKIVTDMATLTKSTWDMMQLQNGLWQSTFTSVQSAQSAYYSVQTQATDIKKTNS